MITGVGYTQDGLVWANLEMEIRGEKLKGTLTMDRNFARQVAADISTAADRADECVKTGAMKP